MGWGKNALIGVALLGGGYIAFRKIKQSFDSAPDIADTAALPSPGHPTQRPKDQLGQPVHKNQKYSTVSMVTINSKAPGMKYARIKGTTRAQNGQTARWFIAPIDGTYTGRILVQGKRAWAEIQPS